MTYQVTTTRPFYADVSGVQVEFVDSFVQLGGTFYVARERVGGDLEQAIERTLAALQTQIETFKE